MKEKLKFRKVVTNQIDKDDLIFTLILTLGIEIIFTIVSMFLRKVPVMLITNSVLIPIVSIISIGTYFNNRKVEYQEI